MAMRLQKELNKSNSKFEPRKTRSEKNPIAEAWNREASTKEARKKRLPADQLDPETKQPRHAGVDLSDDSSAQSIDLSANAKRLPGDASVASSKPGLRKSPIELLDDCSDEGATDFDESAKTPYKTTNSDRKSYK